MGQNVRFNWNDGYTVFLEKLFKDNEQPNIDASEVKPFPLPEGFEFYGVGPLKVCADEKGNLRQDVARFFCKQEEEGKTEAIGTLTRVTKTFVLTGTWQTTNVGFGGIMENEFYALRIGSQIWKNNK